MRGGWRWIEIPHISSLLLLLRREVFCACARRTLMIYEKDPARFGTTSLSQLQSALRDLLLSHARMRISWSGSNETCGCYEKNVVRFLCPMKNCLQFVWWILLMKNVVYREARVFNWTWGANETFLGCVVYERNCFG